MARVVKTVSVTVNVEFDSEDESNSYVDMAIPAAFDLFNEGSDYVTLSCMSEDEVSRTEIEV